MKTYMTLQAKEDQERDEYRARAEVAEAEVVRLQDRIKELAGALGLASAFVAKANADGAYSNTTMTGERALAIISDALGYDNDGAYVRLTDELAATLRALIGCDGDEGRDTSEYVARWEAIMGDKWQG